MKSKTAILTYAWVRKRRRCSTSCLSVVKKLSHRALSQQSPTDPIEGRIPTSLQRRPNYTDVY